MRPPDALPVQPIRDRFLTRYAGVTFDLRPWEVGMNETMLEASGLRLDDRVVVIPGGAWQESVPFAGRPTHRIVPLDASRPDALRLSPRGEAVFSTFELDDAVVTPLPLLRRGDPVVLNASLSRFSVDLRRPT